MALNAYLTVTGDTQGEIMGSVTQEGREDSILVVAVYHEVETQRDAASGLPTGKRQHSPLTIVKEIDKSSPLLNKVLVDNENLTSVSLQFWRPSKSGKEQQHYTITLENANVAGIRLEMMNNKYPENMNHREYERVEFTYQKIVWTWMDGGITAEDDWETPNV